MSKYCSTYNIINTVWSYILTADQLISLGFLSSQFLCPLSNHSLQISGVLLKLESANTHVNITVG